MWIFSYQHNSESERWMWYSQVLLEKDLMGKRSKKCNTWMCVIIIAYYHPIICHETLSHHFWGSVGFRSYDNQMSIIYNCCMLYIHALMHHYRMWCLYKMAVYSIHGSVWLRSKLPALHMSHLLSLKTTWLSSYHYKGLMCYVEYDRVNYYSLQTWIWKKNSLS